MSDYVHASEAFACLSDGSLNGSGIVDASDGCSLSSVSGLSIQLLLQTCICAHRYLHAPNITQVPDSGYSGGDEQGEFLQSASSGGWITITEAGEILPGHVQPSLCSFSSVAVF
jgi:hypothetical protein